MQLLDRYCATKLMNHGGAVKKEQILVYGAAIGSMLFWASSFVWFKVAFRQYRPIEVVFLRLVISSLALIGFQLVTRKSERIAPEDRKTLALLAFFEPFCYFLGESFGMNLVSPTIGSIIVSTIPLFTPVFAHVFIGERITRFTVFGILVSFAGVVLIIMEKADGPTSLVGILLMFFAVFSGITYGVLLRRVAHRYSGITIVKAQNIMGALYFLPLFLIFDSHHFFSTVPQPETIYTIIKLAIFSSSLAFILFTYAMRHIGLTNANVFTNLIPVFTAVIAYIVLGEIITVQKVAGIAVVIGGLFISQIPQLRRRRYQIA
jgi:drug/metabolite transporter (DMT)-like permease